MSTRGQDKKLDREKGEVQAAFESGVVPKDLVRSAVPAHAPPWEVVDAYLATGAHRFWVEVHMARSHAFAEVVAALRSDREEARRGVVVPIRRRR